MKNKKIKKLHLKNNWILLSNRKTKKLEKLTEINLKINKIRL